MLDAIVASTLGNPQTIRMAATVNSAMFDAQNGVGRQRYRPIFVTDRAPRGTHRRAAMVQAAYVTLKSFYPEQLSRFDEAARVVSRRVRRRRLGRSPARHRVGRIRREPDPGVAGDRRLQRPGTSVYRCRCNPWPVGVRNRYQHGGGQPRLHRPFRADAATPSSSRLFRGPGRPSPVRNMPRTSTRWRRSE